MTFTRVKEAAQQGERIRRAGWSGGYFLVYQDGSVMHPDQARNPALQKAGKPVIIAPHFDMLHDHSGHLNMHVGWSPVVEDITAEDWEVVQ